MPKITEEQAKDFLREKGYYVDNLWSVADVKAKFKCTDDEAQTVLSGALQNEATMEQIWYAIQVHGENEGLEPVEESEQ